MVLSLPNGIGDVEFFEMFLSLENVWFQLNLLYSCRVIYGVF